jgi:hypothetical protein
MKQTMFRAAEIANEIPGDVGINGIRWQENEIVFDLSVAGWRGELTCFWVTDLKIELDYGEYGGVIPAFCCVITRIEKAGWFSEPEM